MQKRIIGAVTGLLFMLVIGWHIYSGMEEEYSAQEATASWPTTAGVVKTSGVRRVTVGNHGSHRSVASISYTYRVDGHEYQSNRFRIPLGSKESASEAVQQHPPGTAVTVHYSPDDPSSAVLDAGLNDEDAQQRSLSRLFFFVGAVFGVAVTIGAVFFPGRARA